MCTSARLALLLALILSSGAAAQGPGGLLPVGPEFRVDSGLEDGQGTPAIAMDADRELTAVWSAGSIIANGILARHLDAAGTPAALEARLDGAAVDGARLRLSETVLSLAGGHTLALWVNSENLLSRTKAVGSGGTISGRFIDPIGQPAGAEFELSGPAGAESLHAVTLPQGGFAAFWLEAGAEQRVVLRFYDDEAQPAGARIVLSAEPDTPCRLFPAGLGATASGDVLAFWGTCATFTGARIQGSGPGAAFSINRPGLPVVRGDGTFVILRSIASAPAPPQPSELDIFGQLYDQAGRPLDSEFLVAGGVGNQSEVAAAADATGRFLVAWSNHAATDDFWVDSDVYARLFDEAGEPVGPEILVNSATAEDQRAPRVATNGAGDWVISWKDESDGRISARLFSSTSSTPCPGEDTLLCLAGGRFQVAVDWREPGSGRTGAGHPVPLTNDTGAFWFFGADNLELVVKILDGRPVNGHFWVFYGALSDVEYTLTVTDTATGLIRTYTNPRGTMASRADTDAFPAPQTTAAARAASRITAAANANEILSLNQNRFDVEVAWEANGTRGQGRAIRLTDETGYFWFFSEANIELIVKVLDGRPVNGRFWVFYGALSDVKYTITVTDTATGAKRTYSNPAGTMASRADTDAF